jgi:hypothetical protein
MAMYLAQINVAKLAHPLESAEMADFVAALDNINALAERSEGFVWRLIGDGGADATSIRIDGAKDLLINMSVWTDVESLRRYVYQSAHAAVMARRAKWFPKAQQAHMALWWIAPGAIPTLADARMRLASIDAHGPTPTAFSFDVAFDADGAPLHLPPFKKDCA